MSVREARDVTRAEIAAAIGVDAAALTRWEAGKDAPRDDTLIRLARFFGVTRGWLRWGEQPREAPPPERLEPMPDADPRSDPRPAPAPPRRKRHRG